MAKKVSSIKVGWKKNIGWIITWQHQMVNCSWVTLDEAGAFLDITGARGEHTALRSREVLQDLVPPPDNEEVEGQRGKVACPCLRCLGQGQEPQSTLQVYSPASPRGVLYSCCALQSLWVYLCPRTWQTSEFHEQRPPCAGASQATLEAHVIITQFSRWGNRGTEMLRSCLCPNFSSFSLHTKLGLNCEAVLTHGILGK